MKKLFVVLFSFLVLLFAGTDSCSGRSARLVTGCQVPIGNYAVYYFGVVTTCPGMPKVIRPKKWFVVAPDSVLAKCGKHKKKKWALAEKDCKLSSEVQVTSGRKGFEGTLTLRMKCGPNGQAAGYLKECRAIYLVVGKPAGQPA